MLLFSQCLQPIFLSFGWRGDLMVFHKSQQYVKIGQLQYQVIDLENKRVWFDVPFCSKCPLVFTPGMKFLRWTFWDKIWGKNDITDCRFLVLHIWRTAIWMTSTSKTIQSCLFTTQTIQNCLIIKNLLCRLNIQWK